MKAARRQNLIAQNPCDNVVRPKVPKAQITILDLVQVRHFLQSIAGADFPELLTIGFWTGARQGELLACRWEDIDLSARTWTIRRTISDDAGTVIVKATKTPAGIRTIALGVHAVAAFAELRRRAMASGNAAVPWVFHAGGELVDRHAVIRAFARALKKAGLPKVSFHSIRHAHASLFLSVEPNIKLLSVRLGHSDVAITLRTYVHLLKGQESDAVDKLDRLLG